MSSIQNNGPQFMQGLKKQIGNNLERAGIYLAGKIKQNLSVAPTDIRRYQGKKGIHYQGIPSSAPGDFPHKVTGHLRSTIAYEMGSDRQSVRIGTNDKIGLYLEVGTGKMAARPWLSKTFGQERATLASIVSTGHK